MINLKKNEIIDVEVEKLAYKGNAIARYGSDNFVIFIKDAVPYDKLKVKIVSLNKHFASAQIVEILEPSKFRIKPFCALYNACGSCQNQNIEYEFLLKQKREILVDIFSNIIQEEKIFNVIKSPDFLKYRCKIQYPARETKNSKRVLLGYFKEKTHEITNIKFCPIQPDIINKITQFIRDNYFLGCYSEKEDQGLLKNVLIRTNSDNGEILLTFVLNAGEKEFNSKYRNEISAFFEKIINEFPNIKGCFVNLNPKKTNKILNDLTIKILGNDFINETLEDKIYHIGPVSFFQVNPKSAVNIFNIVKDNVIENSTILDAYGGVGAIGIWLKEKAKKITLVEENNNAILMAHDNFKLNKVRNYEIFEGDVKNHLNNFKSQNKIFDYSIVDPPRSGCEKHSLDMIADISKNIIYVSCNPLTLKRDIVFLKEKGFKPQFIQGVDLFPYTYHIESICVLKKEV